MLHLDKGQPPKTAHPKASEIYSKEALAAKEERYDVVRYLVKKGADISKLDDCSDSALHWAAYKGNLHTAALLHYLGLPADAADSYGSTPLHLATGRSTLLSLIRSQPSFCTPSTEECSLTFFIKYDTVTWDFIFSFMNSITVGVDFIYHSDLTIIISHRCRADWCCLSTATSSCIDQSPRIAFGGIRGRILGGRSSNPS